MRSFTMLMEEHRVIEMMLSFLDAAALRLEAGGEVPSHLLDGAIEFLTDYADRCHHAKEEEALFPLLETLGLCSTEPAIVALKAQHEAGRFYVSRIRREVEELRDDGFARTALITDIRAYVELLREHIRTEDEYFYSLAGARLSPADDEILLAKFEAIERASGRDVHEHYHRLLKECQQAAAGWESHVPA